uniref:Putative secreted protein n=1 Tax=Panstrongylus lignarius TaxID=156445 RepID=A0A224XT01_9HEMI
MIWTSILLILRASSMYIRALYFLINFKIYEITLVAEDKSKLYFEKSVSKTKPIFRCKPIFNLIKLIYNKFDYNNFIKR